MKIRNGRSAAPVDPNSRIELIDVIRGFAILGIIFDNVLYFGGYMFMPFSELQRFWTYPLDRFLFDMIGIVVDGKFYRMFALLFGVGFYLQFIKNRENPGFIGVYRRRLLILLGVGIIHSLVWNGDILLMYALVGFILVFFRNVPEKKLLWLSVFFLLFFVFTDLIAFLFYPVQGHSFAAAVASNAHVGFPDMKPEVVMGVSMNGSVWQGFMLNIHHLVWKWMGKIPAGNFTTTIGMFLLGFYLAGRRFFSDGIKSKRLLLVSFLAGVVCSVSASIVGGSMVLFPPKLSNTFLYKILISAGQLFLCLFYLGILGLIFSSATGKRILRYLAPVGRMALTNYLAQTFLQVILFYNFGFGLVGRIGVSYSLLFAVAILVFQIIISNIWLKHFRFGPVEWIWRSLTYRRRISLKH